MLAVNWQVTLLPNAPTPNTYQISNVARSSTPNCYNLLAAYPCSYGYGPAATTFNQVTFGCQGPSPACRMPG